MIRVKPSSHSSNPIVPDLNAIGSREWHTEKDSAETAAIMLRNSSIDLPVAGVSSRSRDAAAQPFFVWNLNCNSSESYEKSLSRQGNLLKN